MLLVLVVVLVRLEVLVVLVVVRLEVLVLVVVVVARLRNSKGARVRS